MEWLNHLFEVAWSKNVAKTLAILFLGFFFARLLSQAFPRLLKSSRDQQLLMILRKTIFYLLVIITLIAALNQLGLDLKVLLGAAGILTVALGFASQTSASNLISGIFLIVEQPFIVGDVIRIGETTGNVLSVDLLSTRLRTFDNLLVRIPNEMLMKSEITNFTHFPIRRIDIQLGIAYKEDIEKVKHILFELAKRNPLCLNEPIPIFIILGFGDSSVNLQFSIWIKKENYVTVKNSIQEEIKKAFEQHHIEIPFPHRSLYAGSDSKPFRVQMVEPLVKGKEDETTTNV